MKSKEGRQAKGSLEPNSAYVLCPAYWRLRERRSQEVTAGSNQTTNPRSANVCSGCLITVEPLVANNEETWQTKDSQEEQHHHSDALSNDNNNDSGNESSPEEDCPEQQALVFQPNGQPKQALIDGQIWPPSFSAEHLRSAPHLEVRPSDVLVCTYPKCGTTWIQHICALLMHKSGEGGATQPLSLSSPMIERMGARYCDGLQHPRLLKTHLQRQHCPASASGRYIFAARNPKDCLVSYFHHHRNFKLYEWANGQFDTFFELFARGLLGFGDYFEHLLGWLPHIGDANVLFLKYEDMVVDLETAVRKIGAFIGGAAARMVADPEQLAWVVRESSIDAMKQNQGRFFPAEALRGQCFVRKGGSRDWKNHMSRAQSDRMDTLFRKRMQGTVAEKWWTEELQWATDTPTAEQKS